MRVSFLLSLFTIVEGTKDAKILGGRFSCKNEFPFVVALNGATGELCVGTLVALNKVMTAGHCVAFDTIFGLMTKNIYVVTGGSIKKDIRTKAAGMQSRHILSIQLHPSFKLKKSGGYYNDIAACILTKPFELSPSVSPVDWIWKDEESYKKSWEALIGSGRHCRGVGWGLINKIKIKPKIHSPDLKVVDLKPKSTAYCRGFRYHEDEDMTKKGEVCLSAFTEGEGVCLGDSGSPLICGRYVFGLLISVHTECGVMIYPARYLLFWPYMDLYDLGALYSSFSKLIFSPKCFTFCLLHFSIT